MTLTKEAASQELTINHLIALYNEFKQDDNNRQAAQTIDLIKKMKTDEFMIGFSGHFSAGKSTMINRLLNHEILPSSPIPTSANVVKINRGDGFARIYYTEEGPVDYEEPYNLESLKDFCKDGDSISRIDIHHSAVDLPDGVAILDTPGIDSANDADRVMTESNMHLIDVLVYVMDYNHVQSEVNLSFLLEMSRRNKPIYIVVNQIDKHQDQEISFASFRSSLLDTLEKWNISYEGVFFTSLKQDDHRYNEFAALNQEIQQLFREKHKWVKSTIFHSARSLVDEHMEVYEQSFDEERMKLSDQLERLQGDLTYEQDVKQLKDTIGELKSLSEKLEQEFREELQTILKNAYLMPFEVREQAKHYLESRQQGFKVGLFFSKKKTVQEQEKRLKEFYQPLQKKAESQIQWHIRDWFVQKTKEYQVYDDELSRQIQQFSVQYEEERLQKLVKPGAQVTGDYVLVYTKDVAEDIKNVYKSAARNLFEQLVNRVEQQNKGILEKREEELAKEEQAVKYRERLKEIVNQINDRMQELQTLLQEETNVTREQADHVYRLIDKQEQNVKKGSWDVKEEPKKEQNQNKQTRSSQLKEEQSLSAEETIARLKKAEELLQGMKGFGSLLADLKEKSKRLKERHFTVALFGAFSAGKSSFANALLGKSILPVSPNPTTAAINKISPPDSEHPDQSARVILKSEKDLWEDLKLAIDQIPDSVNTVEQLHTWLSKTSLSKVAKNHQHVHLSFLQAFLNGYEEMKDHIGKEILVSMEESSRYIAEEEKACFVESIELFYDCELTRSNITLVDTPGADSINARHTDVSFDYIKNSDAILFVTYYNHPFSRADREFLMQLGRVKDVFTLDKMFFVVNAADLAETEDDLRLVLSYIEEQLAIHGIRNPRIYPVSSKWAMEGKMGDEKRLHSSNIAAFESSFYEFIQQDLTGLLTQSAVHDLKRTYQTLNEFIKSASLNKQEKEERRNMYQENLRKMTDVIHRFEGSSYEQSLKHELKELLYYIQQRVFLGFSDLFKESFHPSVIQSTGKKGKEEIAGAFEELISYLRKQMIQELQATTLRMERFISQRLTDANDELLKEIRAVDEHMSFPEIGESAFQPVTFKSMLDDIQTDSFKKALSLYKNPKSFFEQNQKEMMKEELQKALEPLAEAALEQERERLAEHYIQEWKLKVTQFKEQRQIAVQEYINSLMESLSDQIDVEDLKEKKEKFKQLIF